MTGKQLGRLALVPVLLSLFPTPAMACVLCTWSLTWERFPPITAWAILSLAWLLTQTVVDRVFRVQHRYTIKLWALVGWIVLSEIMFILGLGPLAMAWMPVPPLLTCLWILLAQRPTFSSKYASTSLSAGAVFLFLFTATYFTETRKAQHMTPADKIIMWQGGALARQMVIQLQQHEPDSAGEYRKLLAYDRLSSFMYAQAVNSLARCGDPKQDLPFVLSFLSGLEERAAKDQYSDYEKDDLREELENSLNQLLGEDLPENTPTSVWREKVDAFLAQGDNPHMTHPALHEQR